MEEKDKRTWVSFQVWYWLLFIVAIQNLLPERSSEKQGEVDVIHIVVLRLSELVYLNPAQTYTYCSLSQLQREYMRWPLSALETQPHQPLFMGHILLTFNLSCHSPLDSFQFVSIIFKEWCSAWTHKPKSNILSTVA